MTYTGDDNNERCLECDGFVSEAGADCVRCRNRQAAARDADRAAEKAAAAVAKRTTSTQQSSRWRRTTLATHVAQLLAKRSGSEARIRFIEENPVSEIFR